VAAVARGYGYGRPMRIQARAGSPVDRRYRGRSALPSGRLRLPRAIAPGIDPAPLDDLLYMGGRVVPQMEFQNLYLGSLRDWDPADIELIDAAIARAMREKRLNHVMAQYFPGARLDCDPRESLVLSDPRPARLDEPAIQQKLVALYDAGRLRRRDLATTLFNLILPPKSVLLLDGDSSLRGLGGYHGSLHIRRAGRRVTLYYSANVYSERLPGGRENGIAAFDRPWKNVVGTLYHELNEFRTDPDVNDAIQRGNDDYLGWMSRSGFECGDQPIFAANSLGDVFKQVYAGSPRRRTPVQLMFSNAVHGAEGPLPRPRAQGPT